MTRIRGAWEGQVSPLAPGAGALRPLGLAQVQVTGGLLAARQEANRTAGLPAGLAQLTSSGSLDNFRRAAGHPGIEPRGPRFVDSDTYKWLEACGWEYARRPSAQLLAWQREVTALVAAAQAPDGYLNTMVERDPDGRCTDLTWSHQHYVIGHLIQAGIAQHRGTGDDALLTVAIRAADHLVATFGPGLDERIDGHPEVETALVELSRHTGDRAYRELAGHFIDRRGHGSLTFYEFESAYFCDRVPVREQSSVEGHAVRAVYLAAGATDVAVETGDEELLAASRRQFAAMLASRSYLTGGIGARWEQESFGDDFELPHDRAYAETCAAIGALQWAWRLLCATGEEGYADAIERILFNAFLAGVSESGDAYLYVNPLEVRAGALAHDGRSPAHGRRGWFDCACCPPNVMRLLASLGSYVATTADRGIQVHQYADCSIAAEFGAVRVDTDYPFGDAVRVTVTESDEDSWSLGLRIPGWASAATVSLADEQWHPSEQRFTIARRWRVGDCVELRLPATPTAVAADPRIDSARGALAFICGPLVYAFEEVDNPGLAELFLAGEPRLDAARRLRVPAVRRPLPRANWPYAPPTRFEAGSPAELIGVPYHAWGSRGAGPMRVWIPTAGSR